MFNDRIIQGDASEVLKDFGDGCVDMVLTSPPYDNLRKYNGAGDSWNHEKFKDIASELYRVVKDGGVVVWVVNDKVEKGSKTGSSFRQALYFMELGFCLNDTMIWVKKNPLPVVRQPRYSPRFEYMFVFSKGKPKTFNPIMRETKCGGQHYTSTAKKMGGESGRRSLVYDVNKKAVEYNVWEMAIAQNKTSHPDVFPIELADRHIKSWSNPGDVVLDPFVGSGTTALSAKALGRHYIGIDMQPEYCEMSEERLKNVKKTE